DVEHHAARRTSHLWAKLVVVGAGTGDPPSHRLHLTQQPGLRRPEEELYARVVAKLIPQLAEQPLAPRELDHRRELRVGRAGRLVKVDVLACVECTARPGHILEGRR